MMQIRYDRDRIKAREIDRAREDRLPDVAQERILTCDDSSDVSLQGGVLRVQGPDIDFREQAVNHLSITIFANTSKEWR